MAKNLYFSDAVTSEQRLYENIVIESLKMYGQDVYYLPREVVSEDSILGEDIESRFGSSHKIEMYIENADGFEGEGDLFTKFGVEIRDEATFVVSRRRWRSVVGQLAATTIRIPRVETEENPKAGDLIYLPLTKSLFEIGHVEHEQPFYQLANLPVFKMRCNLFEYSGQDLDTGIASIDQLELDDTYQVVLTLANITKPSTLDFQVGEIVKQTTSSGVEITGEIINYNTDTNKITVNRIGTSDGKLHKFFVSSDNARRIRGETTNAEGDISVFLEDNKISENEQNDFFSSEGTGFIDFSENNPFGDPE